MYSKQLRTKNYKQTINNRNALTYRPDDKYQRMDLPMVQYYYQLVDLLHIAQIFVRVLLWLESIIFLRPSSYFCPIDNVYMIENKNCGFFCFLVILLISDDDRVLCCGCKAPRFCVYIFNNTLSFVYRCISFLWPPLLICLMHDLIVAVVSIASIYSFISDHFNASSSWQFRFQTAETFDED